MNWRYRPPCGYLKNVCRILSHTAESPNLSFKWLVDLAPARIKF